MEMKKGLQIRNLGELCRIRTGKKDVNQGNPDGEFPFFTCAAEHTFSDNYSFDTEALLIAGNGDVGKVSYYNGKFEAYQRTYVLSDFTEVSPRFLYLILDGKLKDTVSKQKLGNTMPYIKVGMLTDFKLPVPPLAEQQRIVGLLDEAFEGLATAKANAQKNLQNARALFESHLQSVFTQRGPGWVETMIGQCIRFIDYRGKTPVKTESGIPLITAKNVKMGFLQETPKEFIAAKDYQSWMTRGIPKMGDVLFTTEAPLANVAQLDTAEKVAFAQRVIIMQPDKAKLDSTFLKYLLLSGPVQKRIRSQGTGATVQGIKASLLKLIEISFPKDLATQQEIVAKLDALSEETTRLAAIYEQKLAALEALKKSLLHQAFTGKL
jgi:type I restriction enzyme S subunit